MDKQQFTVALKSSIDKILVDIALAEGVEFVDLDDAVNTEALFKTQKDAIVWEFNVLQESPRDPLYAAAFNVGARTVEDSSNYDILKLSGALGEVFKEGNSIDIYDYTPETGPLGDKGGYFMVSEITMNPQLYDRMSGIRMITVSGRAVRTLG